LSTLILKSLIEGVYIATYSAVKPGCIHRFRPDGGFLEVFSSTVSALDYIIKAIEYGERVRRGEIAALNIEIGQLLAKALREAYRWCGEKVYPSTIIPQVIYAFALSHSNVDSFIRDSGKVRNSLSLILSINRWSEIRQLLDALKSIHKEQMIEHLTAAGITPLTGVSGTVNFAEVFRVLSSRWPSFMSLDVSEYHIPVYVRKLIEKHQLYNDIESAVVALYLDMIKPKLPNWALQEIESLERNHNISSREGFKKLLEIDMKLRRSNITFDDYVGLLAIVVGLAIYEGLRV